jgi:hypothetical protein
MVVVAAPGASVDVVVGTVLANPAEEGGLLLLLLVLLLF